MSLHQGIIIAACRPTAAGSDAFSVPEFASMILCADRSVTYVSVAMINTSGAYLISDTCYCNATVRWRHRAVCLHSSAAVSSLLVSSCIFLKFELCDNYRDCST